MKKNILKICGLVGFACLSALSFNTKKEDNTNLQNNPKYECINLADQLLNDYYGDVKAANEGKEICSFEDFCNTYRESYLDIAAYTDKVCQDPMLEENDYVFNVPVKKSSNDENYIIGKDKSWKNTGIPKTAFKREPINRHYYEYTLEVGDIIYETFTFVGSTGHCACVTNPWINTSETNSSQQWWYTQTIEAVGSGVNYGFVDDERICKFGILIYRYELKSGRNLSQKQKTSIKNFLYEQIGKKYNFFTGYGSDIDKKEWMCSILVEAAFDYSGVKLFEKSQKRMPDALVKSDKLKQVRPFISYLKVNVVYSYKLVNVTSSNIFYNHEITVTNRSGNQVKVDYFKITTTRQDAAKFNKGQTMYSMYLAGNQTSGGITYSDAGTYHTIALRYVVNNYRNTGKNVSFITVYDFANKLERYTFTEN